MNKYVVTKEKCQEQIDKLGYVCTHCGRTPVPLETVDNAGNPTYWSGCFHGNKDGWSSFVVGVPKEIFELAEKLLLDGHTLYYDKDDYYRGYQHNLYKLCMLLVNVERLKVQEPRFTKKEFEDLYKPKEV